jgi:hypothetical protein
VNSKILLSCSTVFKLLGLFVIIFFCFGVKFTSLCFIIFSAELDLFFVLSWRVVSNILGRILLPLAADRENWKCFVTHSSPYSGRMFNAFELCVAQSALSIKVSCAGLLLSIEIYRYRSVCCTLTDEEPVAGLIAYSLRKSIVMEYSHVHKWRFGIKHKMIGKRKIERTKQECLL